MSIGGRSEADWRHGLLAGLIYAFGYLGSDYISFIEPYRGMDIAPWSPQAGLTVAVAALCGWKIAPLALAMPFAADGIVRHFPFPWGISLAASLAVSGAYVCAGLVLRANGRFSLQSLRDVMTFELVTAAAAALAAGSYCLLLLATGVLSRADLLPVAARFWIGDLVGILVVTPLLFVNLGRKIRELLAVENLTEALMIVTIVVAAIGLFGARSPVLLLSLTFPIIRSALRDGVAGAARALAFAQVAVVAVSLLVSGHKSSFEDFEVAMAVLSVTTLLLAAISAESKAVLAHAEQEHIALSQRLRGRFTAEAVALLSHEMNQPLSAMKGYLGVLANPKSSSSPEAADTIQKLDEQLCRTEKIIRSVHDFTAPAARPVALDVVAELQALVSLLRGQAEANAIRFDIRISHNTKSVKADPIQFQQAVYNLLLNAIESVAETGRGGVVTIATRRIGACRVEISVEDTGPGFSKQTLTNGPDLFRTTKPNGSGIGLSVVRSIAEANCGNLSIGNRHSGAVVRLILPE